MHSIVLFELFQAFGTVQLVPVVRNVTVGVPLPHTIGVAVGVGIEGVGVAVAVGLQPNPAPPACTSLTNPGDPHNQANAAIATIRI